MSKYLYPNSVSSFYQNLSNSRFCPYHIPFTGFPWIFHYSIQQSPVYQYAVPCYSQLTVVLEMFLSECVVPWVILSTYHYNMLECSKCFTCSTSKFLWQKGLSQPISWQKGLFQPILVHLQKCPGCLVPFLWVRVHKCWSQVFEKCVHGKFEGTLWFLNN